jgi:hypothetical protein
MASQADKGRALRALHDQTQTFIIPNPWDAGSARILEAMGFAALATTSAGFANSIGRLDGAPGRDAVLERAATLVRTTELPISADLENVLAPRPRSWPTPFGAPRLPVWSGVRSKTSPATRTSHSTSRPRRRNAFVPRPKLLARSRFRSC